MPYVYLADDDGVLVDDLGREILADISVGFDAPVIDRSTTAIGVLPPAIVLIDDNNEEIVDDDDVEIVIDYQRADSIRVGARRRSSFTVTRPTIGTEPNQ